MMTVDFVSLDIKPTRYNTLVKYIKIDLHFTVLDTRHFGFYILCVRYLCFLMTRMWDICNSYI